MGRLEGKAAVVLGAAGRGNMAQCIAKRFREEGAQVLVAGRKMDELERFAREIDGHAFPCDITRKADVDALARASLDRMGRSARPTHSYESGEIYVSRHEGARHRGTGAWRLRKD